MTAFVVDRYAVIERTGQAGHTEPRSIDKLFLKLDIAIWLEVL